MLIVHDEPQAIWRNMRFLASKQRGEDDRPTQRSALELHRTETALRSVCPRKVEAMGTPMTVMEAIPKVFPRTSVIAPSTVYVKKPPVASHNAKMKAVLQRAGT